MTKIIKCPACSCEVSSQAAACPQCGHLFKSAGAINLRDPVHLVGIALGLLMLAGIVLTLWQVLP